MDNNVWEPYFRPSTRVHSSGFRCFECGYLQIGDDKKAKKKIVLRTRVDHITTEYGLDFIRSTKINIDLDLLRDGNIRIFHHNDQLYWNTLLSSDAFIVNNKEIAYPAYDELNALWEKREKEKDNETV